jgi:hypothetical protein
VAYKIKALAYKKEAIASETKASALKRESPR